MSEISSKALCVAFWLTIGFILASAIVLFPLTPDGVMKGIVALLDVLCFIGIGVALIVAFVLDWIEGF